MTKNSATEMITKYVQEAEHLLTKEGGKFNESDVEKLAVALIDLDSETELQKEAETIIGKSMIDELIKKGVSVASIKASLTPLTNKLRSAATRFMASYKRDPKAFNIMAGTAGAAGLVAGRMSKSGE